jgi:hypothetical protein
LRWLIRSRPQLAACPAVTLTTLSGSTKATVSSRRVCSSSAADSLAAKPFMPPA